MARSAGGSFQMPQMVFELCLAATEGQGRLSKYIFTLIENVRFCRKVNETNSTIKEIAF